MAVIIKNMHMPTTCTMCWISNICQEHIHDLKHIGYDRRLDDCPLQELPSAEPDYDLDGYSSRLWKAAYERGKAEAQRKKDEERYEQVDRLLRDLGISCAYDMPSFWANKKGKSEYVVIPDRYHKGYQKAIADVEEGINKIFQKDGANMKGE